MKIAVGTVQFGLRYGIANRGGQTPRGMAAAILDRARAAGATVIDTAIDYGQAETVLGEIGAARSGWRIITKLPGLPSDLSAFDVAAWCKTTVESSIRRLGASHLDALLIHRPNDLYSHRGQALADALVDLRHRGLTSATGVSIYGPDDLEALLPGGLASAPIPLEIVQSPASVLDRRLETSGWAEKLLKAGTRIHLRSILLQGLLLMPPADLPAYLADAAQDLRRWHNWLAESGVDALAGALRFALSRQYAECAVVGMDNLDHLEQILAAAKVECPMPPSALESTNSTLLDPRKWTKL